MGSWGKFTPIMCIRCCEESWINSVDGPCLNCQNDFFERKMIRSTVLQHLFRSGRLPYSLVRMVISYVHWQNATSEFKRRYMLEMLLSSGSVFRRFTYFYIAFCGSISQHEDVVARVIAFVV